MCDVLMMVADLKSKKNRGDGMKWELLGDWRLEVGGWKGAHEHKCLAYKIMHGNATDPSCNATRCAYYVIQWRKEKREIWPALVERNRKYSDLPSAE